MNKRKVIEGLKTLVIILLTLSALLLIKNSEYFGILSDKLYLSGEGDVSVVEPIGTAEKIGDVMPLGISVLIGENSKHTSIYDGEALEQCYHRFSALLGEALGSAEAAREISATQWDKVLERSGVFISYRAVQYCQVLAKGFGTSASEAISELAANVFVLVSGEDESAELYFADTENGKFYLSKTAVSANTLVNAVGEFQPNDGAFARDYTGLDAMHPYTLIPGETPEVKTVKASNPMGEEFDMSRVYRVFDFNSGALLGYEEADGTKVLVESGRTMRISLNGDINFSGSESFARSVSLTEAVSQAYAALNTVTENCIGEAELVLRSAQILGQNYVVEFDYCVNGIAVELPSSEPAARFVIGAQGIEQAQIKLRSYTFTGEIENLLPVAQACALAGGKKASGLEIVYRDNGSEVHAAWVIDKTE